MRTIHFLHIGKNAGTQIQNIAKQINGNNEDCQIQVHGHRTILIELPPQSEYFFSIRQPVARFKSAFYSRKRKGQPKLYVEWTKHEREMFSTFEHANDLAEALFENSPRGQSAFSAMISGRHFVPQYSFFVNGGDFLKFHAPLTILRQEKLTEDVEHLMSLLKLKNEVSLTDDPVLSHRNDYQGFPELSDKAKRNLNAWYILDIQFLRYCDVWIRNTQSIKFHQFSYRNIVTSGQNKR